jgi:hypothetical protein
MVPLRSVTTTKNGGTPTVGKTDRWQWEFTSTVILLVAGVEKTPISREYRGHPRR